MASDPVPCAMRHYCARYLDSEVEARYVHRGRVVLLARRLGASEPFTLHMSMSSVLIGISCIGPELHTVDQSSDAFAGVTVWMINELHGSAYRPPKVCSEWRIPVTRVVPLFHLPEYDVFLSRFLELDPREHCDKAVPYVYLRAEQRRSPYNGKGIRALDRLYATARVVTQDVFAESVAVTAPRSGLLRSEMLTEAATTAMRGALREATEQISAMLPSPNSPVLEVAQQCVDKARTRGMDCPRVATVEDALVACDWLEANGAEAGPQAMKLLMGAA